MTSKTKKWIFGTFVAAVIIAFVCMIILKSDEPTYKTIEECIAEDIATAQQDSNYVCWYEVDCMYNAGLDTTAIEDLNITNYIFVYQTKDTVRFIMRDFLLDTKYDSCICGHWGGTFSMDERYPDVNITAKYALESLKTQDSIPVPMGQFMTLRCPFGDTTSHPSYLFGSIHTSIVFVDGVTGDIFTEDALECSGIEVEEE